MNGYLKGHRPSYLINRKRYNTGMLHQGCNMPQLYLFVFFRQEIKASCDILSKSERKSNIDVI